MQAWGSAHNTFEKMGRPKGHAAVLQMAPAYTFGSKCSPPSSDDKVPGPGTYQPRLSSSDFISSRGAGFGTSGRLAPYGEGLEIHGLRRNAVAAFSGSSNKLMQLLNNKHEHLGRPPPFEHAYTRLQVLQSSFYLTGTPNTLSSNTTSHLAYGT